ncbi:organic cation transporter protein-like isoform X2 [Periplaneta americana]|uniref:organic cation transporter protein-like isoform X2 n=1 Tax=Periplaneta americana TaxID=6978 RepID=UPI0037E9882C
METTSEATMNVDDMLALAGDFGRYQYLLMLLFSIINVLSAFHYFAQTFISIEPEHYCANSGLECSEPDSNGSLVPCSSGWLYNLTGGFDTVVSELDWVCNDNWKAPVGQSLFFIGSVIGSLGLGVMADHVGRLPVLVLSNLLALIGNIATSFTNHLPEFAASRLLAGIATDTNFFMMYIIVMEYMRPDMRTLGLNLCIGVFYCVGCVAVPWVALVSSEWRRFLWFVSAPLLLVPGYYWLLPESARWLINKGRIAEAVGCFQRIAAFNGRGEIPSSAIDNFKATSEKCCSQTSASLVGLFRTPRLRRKTCILIFKSMVLTLCYDAISRNVEDMGYSPFEVFSISSATILPSCVVILLLQDRVGRKAMASASLLFTGLFIGSAGVIQAFQGNDTNALMTVALGVVGRFGVNIAYNSGAQYAAELIPTEVRGQGVAFVHVAGYAATFFSPHILYLASYWRAIPELILGTLSTMGAALCLLLPETMNKALPLTLADGEDFGEGEGIWEFACCKKEESDP